MARFRIALILLVSLAIPALVVWGQQKAARPKVRAEVPKWDKNRNKLIFFDDLFKEALVGKRPDFGASKVAGNSAKNGQTVTAAGTGFAWSKIISATTLEDEVKSSKKVLDEEVSTPAKFAGSGYKVARRQFTVLAAVFAIIGEYDGEVRWKADGPAARDLFARAAANCKVGTIPVFNEATARKTDLEELLRGSGIKDRKGEVKSVWPQVADRAPLMRRLEMAHQQRMQPWIGNKTEFKNHADEMTHEAELAATIAEILKNDGMEDGSDAEYAAFCDRLKRSALDVVDAVQRSDYDKARAAVGEVDKTCTECHQNYRATN